MAWIVDQEKEKILSLPAKMLKPESLKKALSPLAWKILTLLADNPSYPKEIGKRLRVHEQKIYYHIGNLEKAGLVKILREERRQGALTKFYTVEEHAFALTLRPLEEATKLFAMKQEYRDFLEPFVNNGKLEALIVIGNHEPHGPTKEMGHDGINATNLALFLGTFLNYIPENVIKFDTQLKEEDMKKNLILIGGPGVNSIVSKINKKLPIKFVQVKYKENYYTGFKSDISGKTYSSESYGIIAKTKNPFEKNKEIMVIAGRKFSGTKAAVLAFSQKLEELCSGNPYNKKVHARVIDGLDMDSDGEVDFVEFVE